MEPHMLPHSMLLVTDLLVVHPHMQSGATEEQPTKPAISKSHIGRAMTKLEYFTTFLFFSQIDIHESTIHKVNAYDV